MLGRTLDTLPNEIHKGVEDKNKNKTIVDSWKERMKISNKFWNAWKKEYLANIRKFSKQNNIEENLKVNDLVLVLTEKVNKFDWPIGRVSNVHKGRDGNARTVEIQIPTKAYLLDDKAKPLTQYKYLTRGIQNISLFKAAEE